MLYLEHMHFDPQSDLGLLELNGICLEVRL
jgi:hypothetical protein